MSGLSNDGLETYLFMGFLMSILRCLVRLAGVLVRGRRVLFACFVITFVMMFGGRPMRLGCVFMVLGGFVMSVFGHAVLLGTNDASYANLQTLARPGRRPQSHSGVRSAF